jgi:hypothetical protein
MTHAWCHNIARDAAVRAAEDNRTGPLPTLGEAIVLAFGFDKASAQRACDEVKSWPEDVQKDCRCVLGDLLEQGVDRLQALVEAWRYGKGLLAARYPAMFPKSVSATSAVEQENKGDGMETDGMRTERVTLEVTHDLDARLSDWIVEVVDESLGLMESVRVVHAPKLASHANDDGGSNHAAQAASEWRMLETGETLRDGDEFRHGEMWLPTGDVGLPNSGDRAYRRRIPAKAASGGGEGEPDYYVYKNEVGMILYTSPKLVNDDWGGCTVEPVYKATLPPRGWLSEDERDIIAEIADDDNWTDECRNIARGLLARSSPPEVVLPKLHTRCEVNEANHKSPCLWFRRPDVIEALAAAGVAVREVGRD